MSRPRVKPGGHSPLILADGAGVHANSILVHCSHLRSLKFQFVWVASRCPSSGFESLLAVAET
ncbi:MAG: hypothetical protein QOI79_3309 [Mycobacterium sp.]|jgi:hypothetical protein|nr:hypothetical protein [Mycobacterium sp.]